MSLNSDLALSIGQWPYLEVLSASKSSLIQITSVDKTVKGLKAPNFKSLFYLHSGPLSYSLLFGLEVLPAQTSKPNSLNSLSVANLAESPSILRPPSKAEHTVLANFFQAIQADILPFGWDLAFPLLTHMFVLGGSGCPFDSVTGIKRAHQLSLYPILELDWGCSLRSHSSAALKTAPSYSISCLWTQLP